MIRKRHLIILAILVSIKILADILFKVHYSNDDIYRFNHLIINENTVIEKGTIICGHNIKGMLEASVFPEPGIAKIDSPERKIEFAYLRFGPDHFKANIAPHLEKRTDKNSEDLLDRAKTNHRRYFRRFAHINDYPLIRENQTPKVIQYRDPDQLIIQNN